MKTSSAALQAVLLVTAVFAPGCESADGSAKEDVAHPTDATPAQDAASSDEGGGGAARLDDPTGTWVQLNVHTSTSEIPMVGTTTSHAVALTRLQLTADDDGIGVAIKGTLCSLEMVSSTDIVKIHMPPEFIAAIDYQPRRATLSESADGQHYAVGRITELRGVSLDDPVADPLPTDPDDPSVLDPDDDGHPGLTVRVTGLVDGEIYVIQRAWEQLTGIAVSGDEVLGEVTWGEEQVSLGADNELLLQFPNDATALGGMFRMLRVDEGQDCAALVERMDELFAADLPR